MLLCDDAPHLSPLKEWARYQWKLKGNLNLSLLGGSLILFDFKFAGEAETVLHEGVRVFKGKVLMLDRWSLEIGYLKEGAQTKNAWVRLVVLPLFLWDKAFFKQVGDAHKGFLGVDKEIVGGRICGGRGSWS